MNGTELFDAEELDEELDDELDTKLKRELEDIQNDEPDELDAEPDDETIDSLVVGETGSLPNEPSHKSLLSLTESPPESGSSTSPHRSSEFSFK